MMFSSANRILAADYYWSPDGSYQTGGSGIWSTSAANWSLDGSAFVAWPGATDNQAIFAGTDGTYAVTVNGNFSAKNISFTASGYTLSASSARTISLASNIPAVSVSSGKTAYIGNNVTLSVAGNSGITGGGTLVIQSGGKLNIGAAVSTNGNTSVILDGGTVSAQNYQLGNTSDTGNSLTIKNGGTLTATGTYGIRFEKGGSNTVNLDGGTLATTRMVNSGGTSTVNLNGGILKVYNASQAVNSFIQVTNAYIKEGGAFFDTNSYSVFITQALLHGGSSPTDGGLTKNNSGMLTLNGANTYTGSTTVNAGSLIINGSLAAASFVIVESGAALGGSGTVNGAVAIKSGGSLSPGTSPGIATYTNQLTLENGSNFQFELTANTESGRGTNFDGVNLTGASSLLTIQSGVTAHLIFNGSGSSVLWSDVFWSVSHSWLIFDSVNTPALASPSIFSDIIASLDSGGFSTTGSFSFSENGSGDIYLNYTAVPEPAVSLLLGSSLALLFILRRKA